MGRMNLMEDTMADGLKYANNGSQSLSIATPQTKLANDYYNCQLEYLIDVSPKFHYQPASGAS